ncbi:hypothetical protein EV142_10254 [Flavobacterium circumlabens]|uniref:Uncharacterized protein n=1 Tax=Flavobacterium circumlabens TaxID=2133765 RepID=A0ABY2B0R5_9FLAO|nr:hypothetical protein EV142_10254 [Flavobacterium circumlabens]
MSQLLYTTRIKKKSHDIWRVSLLKFSVLNHFEEGKSFIYYKLLWKVIL